MSVTENSGAQAKDTTSTYNTCLMFPIVLHQNCQEDSMKEIHNLRMKRTKFKVLLRKAREERCQAEEIQEIHDWGFLILIEF